MPQDCRIFVQIQALLSVASSLLAGFTNRLGNSVKRQFCRIAPYPAPLRRGTLHVVPRSTGNATICSAGRGVTPSSRRVVLHPPRPAIR